jgi:hypothetical protein
MISPYVHSLVESLTRFCRRKSRSRARRPVRRVLPGVELLEDRTTPSVDIWTGANQSVDTNWSDSLNWSSGVPTSSSVVQFTQTANLNTTSTINQAFTIAGLQIDPTWAALSMPARP